MKTKILLLLVLVGFLIGPFKGKAQSVNVQDSLALVDLYDSTGGPGWINHTNWLTSAQVSMWFGVTVSSGRVEFLQLANNKLIGNIPSSIGNLSAAYILDLSNNQLKGSIPASLSNLSGPLVLSLQNNQLSGPVPTSLNTLNAFSTINLQNNNLTFSGFEQLVQNIHFVTCSPQSDIPLIINGNTYSVAAGGTRSNNTYKWFKNDTMVATKVGDSTFTITPGASYSVQVTNSIVNLTLYSIENANTRDSLALIDIYNSTKGANWINSTNWLTSAPLATWYGVTVRNKSVSSLALSTNNLSETIPSSISNLLNITSIDFSSNKITGNIPLAFGKMASVNSLVLRDNMLSGSIPDSLSYMSALSNLNLNTNNLTGNIPNSLAKLTNLTELDVSHNQLTGSIPDSLSKLSNLIGLYLYYNQLTGSIPASLGKLSNLNSFYANDNDLTGSIPSSLGSIPSLVQLILSHNNISGSIPDSLGYAPQLGRLYVDSNQLTGSIPNAFNNLSNLFSLRLNNNRLSGNLPDSLEQRFGDFDIAVNNFNFTSMANLPTSSQLSALIYAPQLNIPYIKNGQQLSVSAGGVLANDTFRLYKDGVLQTTQTGDSIFTIPSFGRYNITVTNPVAPLLTLTSDTLTINSDSLILPARPNTEFASYEYTDTLGWTHYYYNNNTPNDLTDDTLLLSLKKNGQDIGTVGDGTFAVKLVATAGAGSNTGLHVTNPLITNTSGYWVMNRYWQVTPTNEPTTSVGVRFYYNNQDLKDVNGSYPTHNLTNNKLIFYKAVGGNPDPTTNLAGATKIISILPGTVASDTSWTYHALSDTTQYGEYSVASFSGGGGGGTGNNEALPVVLINFTASLLKNDAQLNWQTSQEVNASNYTVERSLTGTGFTAIGTVEAAGNSAITQSYKFTDYNAALLNTATLYYRLKITDKDGNFTYSKIIKLDIGGTNAFVVYPNPAQNTATIAFTATAAGKYAIEITDIAGKTVKVIEGISAAGSNTATVDVHNYAQGAYIIKIQGDYISKQSLKLLKQ